MKTRVLMVDDEKEFIQTLSERLTLRDYDVTTAFSGEEAIEKVKSYLFDVIILDVLMPGMSGIETLREVNHRDGHRRDEAGRLRFSSEAL